MHLVAEMNTQWDVKKKLGLKILSALHFPKMKSNNTERRGTKFDTMGETNKKKWTSEMGQITLGPLQERNKQKGIISPKLPFVKGSWQSIVECSILKLLSF